MSGYTFLSRIFVWLILSALLLGFLLPGRRVSVRLRGAGLVWLFLGSFVLGGLLTWWGVLWQQSILPRNVVVQIENIGGEEEVDFEEVISGTVLPRAENIYILIHPHSTEWWYVQTEPTVSAQNWSTKIFFGESENSDCGLKFDILVMASRDAEWLDIFRGRVLQPGAVAGFLPVLNQSQMITVTRVCR